MLKKWETHNSWPYPMVNHHISYQQIARKACCQHLNWGYCIYFTFLDALKWGNGENDQPLDLGVPSISWPKMRQLHDPELSPPWRLDSRFDIWALRWMINKKDLFRKFTHPFADLFLIAFSDQNICLTWWGGKNCVLQPKMCRLPVKREAAWIWDKVPMCNSDVGWSGPNWLKMLDTARAALLLYE